MKTVTYDGDHAVLRVAGVQLRRGIPTSLANDKADQALKHPRVTETPADDDAGDPDDGPAADAGQED